MFTLRLVVLFIHVTAVIVALGGSLFSTFALTPILVEELDPSARLKVARRVIRRLGTIVLTALGVLVFTGILNVMFLGVVSMILIAKLVLVTVVIVLALYQYEVSAPKSGGSRSVVLTRRSRPYKRVFGASASRLERSC